jgi:hypothetical protein
VKLLGSLMCIAALPALAFAADAVLLSLIPPSAKAVAGIQADQARNSAFGQYVLSRIQPGDANLSNFIAETGFDPRQDLSEIVVASDSGPKTPPSHWLAAGKGVFNAQKLTAAAQAGGGTLGSFNNVAIVTYPAHGNTQAPSGIAFLDASTAVMGDIASVQAAIQQWQSQSAPNSSLLDKVNQVSANEDFWFVTLAPLSDFTSALPPGSNPSGANMLGGVNQLSGGIHFGDTVMVSGEAIARSDKDAQALADVLKFAVGMLQMNRQNNPAAGQIATLLDSLDTKTQGNVTTFSIAVPEQQLEKWLATAQQPATRNRMRARPRLN